MRADLIRKPLVKNEPLSLPQFLDQFDFAALISNILLSQSELFFRRHL